MDLDHRGRLSLGHLSQRRPFRRRRVIYPGALDRNRRSFRQRQAQRSAAFQLWSQELCWPQVSAVALFLQLTWLLIWDNSLAYFEMRLCLARLLFNFDLEPTPAVEGWTDQNIYLLWQKKPLFVKLVPRDVESAPGVIKLAETTA